MSDKKIEWDWNYLGPAIVILAICFGIGGCCAIINLTEKPHQNVEAKP